MLPDTRGGFGQPHSKIAMKKQNRIISLIDFSEYSNKVIQFTADFSRLIDARVVFVHRVPGMVPALADSESRRQIIDHEKEVALQKLKEQAGVYFSPAPQFEVSDKHLLTIFKELKDEGYFDWVVAGLKGTGMVKKVFMGSTTLMVIEETRLPTVAIPMAENISLPKELVVVVSSKYPINAEMLKPVMTNLSGSVVKTTFISIITETDDELNTGKYFKELENEFKAFNTMSVMFKGVDPFEEIQGYFRDKSDVFLVAQQGSGTLTDALFGDHFINELVYHGSIPLIVLSE